MDNKLKMEVQGRHLDRLLSANEDMQFQLDAIENQVDNASGDRNPTREEQAILRILLESRAMRLESELQNVRYRLGHISI